MNRKAKRELWRYDMALWDGSETWELRETNSGRWYFYRDGVCYGWSFSREKIQDQLRESAFAAGARVVRQTIEHVEVPPKQRDRRPPKRQPSENLDSDYGWFETNNK